MVDDNRLKILWIEDKADIFAVDLDNLGEEDGAAFSVEVLSRLDAILDLRTRTDQVDTTPNFDVVVCDFNLVDGHILPADTETAGLKSRAAGFMIGTLLALREPHRPRAVVPYSQNQEEFGETFRLFRSYLPRSIAIAEAFETDKAQLDKTRVFIRATEAYRDSLIRLSRSGRAHFSDDTIRWLLSARDGSIEISAEETLEVTFIGGYRRLHLKSLFYQEYCDGFYDGNYARLSAALTEFIDQLSFKNTDFIEARELADRYWDKSNSADSYDAYLAASPTVHDLAGGSRARWLMTDDHARSPRVKSYAAVDLLMRSYVQTVLVRSTINAMAQSRDDEEDSSAVRLNEVVSLTLALVGASSGSFFARCLQEQIVFFERDAARSLEDLLDRLDQVDRKGRGKDGAPPTWEQRWMRAMDPLPKAGQALHHTGPRGIGKTLAAYLTTHMGEELNENIGPQLISGSNTLRLAPELSAIARLFALEYIPEGLPWPAFLLRGGQAL